ncbi:MAG TPA: hypothetical protein VGF43_00535 [Dongiaceae bacterium]|jgi:hypothetical protein
MITRAFIIAGLLALPCAGTALAADHLFTALAAGGLTLDKQPFQNGLNNPGRFNDDVPGQGSPLSGEDHTTPATDTHTGQTHMPKPAIDGKTAPSQHSAHVK